MEQKRFPTLEEIDVQLLIPKNENLKPVLNATLGEELYQKVEELLGKKCYRDSFRFGKMLLEIHIKGGEDIAPAVLQEANPQKVGVTGSDFFLNEILKISEKFKLVDSEPSQFPQFEEAEDTNLRTILKEIRPGNKFILQGEGKKIQINILNVKDQQQAFLCLLGPNDTTLQEIIESRKKQKKAIKVVCEERLSTLIHKILDYFICRQGGSYQLKTVVRSTEGEIRKGGEPERDDLFDIVVDIGQTFKTARANGLEPYIKIMRSYPIEIHCFPINALPVSLEKIKSQVKEGLALAYSPKK